MTEAAYRAELARGRIDIEDIDAVLGNEPDALVSPAEPALRRAMMTPGVREFDAATILWRAEQGDLATDFRQRHCKPCSTPVSPAPSRMRTSRPRRAP